MRSRLRKIHGLAANLGRNTTLCLTRVALEAIAKVPKKGFADRSKAVAAAIGAGVQFGAGDSLLPKQRTASTT